MATRRIKIEVTYTSTKMMAMNCKWEGDTDYTEVVLGISPSYTRIAKGLLSMGVAQSLVDVIFDDLRLYRESNCDKSIDAVRSYVQERTLPEPAGLTVEFTRNPLGSDLEIVAQPYTITGSGIGSKYEAGHRPLDWADLADTKPQQYPPETSDDIVRDIVSNKLRKATGELAIAMKTMHEESTAAQAGSYSRAKPTSADVECIQTASDNRKPFKEMSSGDDVRSRNLLTTFPYKPFTDEEAEWCLEHAKNVQYKQTLNRMNNEIIVHGGGSSVLKMRDIHQLILWGPTGWINNALALMFRNNNGELPEYTSVLHIGTVLELLDARVPECPFDFLRVDTAKLLMYLADREFKFDGEVRDYLIKHVTNNGHYDRTLRQRLGSVLKHEF